MEEIADTRIIAIAEDGFVFEVIFVVSKLSFYVRKYCVELIVLFTLCFVKIFD